jgi:hypothetical protein
MVAIMTTFLTENMLRWAGSLADIGDARGTAATDVRAAGGGIATDGGKAADEDAATGGIAGWGGVTVRTGGYIAQDGGETADRGAATGGITGWEGVKARTGVAGTEGVVIVRGGVSGGKKQQSTCGICLFLASTKAWLLAVASLYFLARFRGGGADGGD